MISWSTMPWMRSRPVVRGDRRRVERGVDPVEAVGRRLPRPRCRVSPTSRARRAPPARSRRSASAAGGRRRRARRWPPDLPARERRPPGCRGDHAPPRAEASERSRRRRRPRRGSGLRPQLRGEAPARHRRSQVSEHRQRSAGHDPDGTGAVAYCRLARRDQPDHAEGDEADAGAPRRAARQHARRRRRAAAATTSTPVTSSGLSLWPTSWIASSATLPGSAG